MWSSEPPTQPNLRRPLIDDRRTERPPSPPGFAALSAAREVIVADLSRDGRYDAPVEPTKRSRERDRRCRPIP